MSLNSLPPIVFKSFIGFDQLFDEISRINHNKNSNYPAFDVIKNDEKNYEINLAVAGFNESEIEIVTLQNILYIKGKKAQNNIQNIIHKGIALRPFEKKFNLDPLMEVAEAVLSKGMLNIKLFKREPEIIKPKKIEIKTI
ncbi:Hsp20 family protein [Alphaproteobacteria bacterium]|nr:Hsp20 family protein [Alphaproteobacteria bacterium]